MWGVGCRIRILGINPIHRGSWDLIRGWCMSHVCFQSVNLWAEDSVSLLRTSDVLHYIPAPKRRQFWGLKNISWPFQICFFFWKLILGATLLCGRVAKRLGRAPGACETQKKEAIYSEDAAIDTIHYHALSAVLVMLMLIAPRSAHHLRKGKAVMAERSAGRPSLKSLVGCCAG